MHIFLYQELYKIIKQSYPFPTILLDRPLDESLFFRPSLPFFHGIHSTCSKKGYGQGLKVSLSQKLE